MDQFLSSISESQPDVTVSSEESVEVTVSEGKPYRPFQVTSLGSRSEPEGEQPRTQSVTSSIADNTVAVWRTTGRARGVSEGDWWRSTPEPLLREGERGLQRVLWQCVVEPWVWTCLCLHSSLWPLTQHYWRADKCTKPQAPVLSWSQELWVLNEQLRLYSLSHLCQTKDWILNEKKKWWIERFQQDGGQITSKSPRNIWCTCQHPRRLRPSQPFWNCFLFLFFFV